ncbi:hypothetical protein KUTeg_006434 [Tegillarca granosa]|uniref:Uncharacterized protein n=1 Tax=Tegillarca granosa TaxID=220873 RepID=A0ABQ9FJF6_TEGGR|nr:hypothetical protein KUTeg_006434 [Tegillarca granosa]
MDKQSTNSMPPRQRRHKNTDNSDSASKDNTEDEDLSNVDVTTNPVGQPPGSAKVSLGETQNSISTFKKDLKNVADKQKDHIQESSEKISALENGYIKINDLNNNLQKRFVPSRKY